MVSGCSPGQIVHLPSMMTKIPDRFPSPRLTRYLLRVVAAVAGGGWTLLGREGGFKSKRTGRAVRGGWNVNYVWL